MIDKATKTDQKGIFFLDRNNTADIWNDLEVALGK